MSLPTIITVLVVLFILVTLFGALFTYIYWWLIQRPLPRYRGELRLSCLTEPVEVLRDQLGIPHIYAGNEADLWRAQGFVHAQDRLWQMEQHRRTASGRMAELFGKPALQVDRFSRVIGFRRAAEAEWETLDTETRKALNHYVEGVNAYIESRPGRLAAEFNLLRYPPRVWTPEDVLTQLKFAGWNASVNWESELVRLLMAGQMDGVRAAGLEPDYPVESPVIQEGVGSQESIRLAEVAGLLLGEYDKLQQWIGPQGAPIGSNSWVLAPDRTTGDRPLLCNDPHMALTMPGIWYENHLSCPTLSVSGASYAGVPGVIIGHNQHMAWGMTNGLADTQDLYVERPHPPGSHCYEYNDEGKEATVLREEIRIKRRDQPHIEEVVITRNGPLISGLVDGAAPIPLALRWTGHRPGRQMAAILGLNRARNWETFNTALDDWQSPVQTVTYADVAGNIGVRTAGQIPVRARGLGLLPSPGWTDDHDWTGTIPCQELPRLYNPPSGMIVAANNRITGDDYPYFLGTDFDPGWRARRIEEMLVQKKRLGLRDMERIQLDTTSLYAEMLTPWLTLADADDPYVKIALNTLRNWNYRMEPASDGALIFHYTKLHLLEMVYGDTLGALYRPYRGESSSPLHGINGFTQRAETRLLDLLRGEETSPWYTEMASGRQRNREELVLEALTRAVRRIRREVNGTPRHWAWGRMHQIRYNHPMGSVRVLRGYFSRGPFPVGGDSTTPNQTAYPPQLPPGLVQIVAVYRQIVEVGNWDAIQSVTTSGQSGHPLSPHFTDQIPMWLEGEYHPMPWSRDQVERATLNRLALTPGKPANGAGRGTDGNR